MFQHEFGLEPEGIEAHFNIAPTDVVAVVTADANGRRLEQMQWGLVPGWAKDPSIGQKLINARAETIAEKPSFRSAFKKRRCLIPADGFFEWKGEKGHKQPFYICMKSARPFAFAGLWEYWEGTQGALVTCTIVTTSANELVSNVHTRMPVILARTDYDAWLDPRVTTADRLLPLLAPYAAEEMEMHAVTKAMSNPRFESPEAVVPIAPTTLF